ncbi:MAG: hypothetical protein ACE5MM_03615 [Nitrospiraceae bacterium]
MKGRRGLLLLAALGLVLMIGVWDLAGAVPYELSKNDVVDAENLKSTDVSLYGVKLGDPESKAYDILVNEKILGVKAEQEGTFILLWDQRRPTGAMAGVQLIDGEVTLIFINNRFAYKARGIFRNVLNSGSPGEIRHLLGKEDFGDENVMGAVLNYEKKGFLVNYLGKDINVEFTFPLD